MEALENTKMRGEELYHEEYRMEYDKNDDSWFSEDAKETHSIALEEDLFLKSIKGSKQFAGKLSIEYDWEFLIEQLQRMQENKKKYPPYNWLKPIDISKLEESLFRHVLFVMQKEYTDENQKYGHLAAIAVNAMFIYRQLKNTENKS